MALRALAGLPVSVYVLAEENRPFAKYEGEFIENLVTSIPAPDNGKMLCE